MSVLIPSLKTDEMQKVLAIFQGRSPVIAQGASLRAKNSSNVVLTAYRVGSASVSAVVRFTDGVVPPNDPACR
jgi:hypothetical protein